MKDVECNLLPYIVAEDIALVYEQKTQNFHYGFVYPITCLVIPYELLAFLDSNHISYCVSEINLLAVGGLKKVRYPTF